jgi:hypothetical protein
MGGIQVKDNETKGRFKPFAHALFGVGHVRRSFTVQECQTPCDFASSRFSDTGFSGAFGGGLDVRINDRIDFRAIQVDYNPVYFGSGFQNNVRFGIGIVIH